MSPFRRKAVENALVSVLREQQDVGFTAKSLRPIVAELLDGCTPAELAGAIQALRYAGKLEWDRLALSSSMAENSAGRAQPAEQEGGAAPVAPPSAGPDDDDEYPGDVNDEAREGPQAEQGPARRQPLPPEGSPGDVPHPVRHDEQAVSGGRVEEPRPDRANDQPKGAQLPGQAACSGTAAGAPVRSPGGWAKAVNMAGSRPVPAPQHESEVERLVREEGNLAADRRRRARSTGTVRQPLELRQFGIPDMNLAESITSLLAEDPADLVAAVRRKHPKLWRRVLLLGRAHGKRPAEALYWALERGLDELEAGTPADQAA